MRSGLIHVAVAIFVFGLLLSFPGAATGGTVFDVTRLDDPLPSGCQPGDCSLREAVIDANANIGHDTINLPVGTITLELAGTNEDLSATGDLDVNDDTTILGAGGASFVDADGIDRVFDIGSDSSADTITVELGHLIVQGGDAGIDNGGGIAAGASSGSMLVLRDSVVRNNVAFQGGGVYTCCGTGAEITDVVVRNNLALDDGGGTFHCCGSSASYEMLRVEILNNNTVDDGGGAFFCCGSSATLTDVTLSGNGTNDQGGGLYHCCNGDTEQMNLFGVTVNGNTAATEGGGVYSCCAGTTVTFVNTTITGNTADEKGGGYHNEHSETGLTRFTNVTITDNAAPMGSGIYNGDDDNVTIVNTIVAANVDGADCARNAVDLLGNNLDSDGSCGGGGVDPLLGPLADNGGFTHTQALLVGSPAIDTGDDAECPAADERGVVRPQGPQCDIGAYEVEAGGVTPANALWGDDDCNGEVAAVDALKNLQEVAGLPYSQNEPCFDLGGTVSVAPAGATERIWGDVDCDSDVDSVDALGILRKLVAFPVNQQPGCPEIGAEVLVGG